MDGAQMLEKMDEQEAEEEEKKEDKEQRKRDAVEATLVHLHEPR